MEALAESESLSAAAIRCSKRIARYDQPAEVRPLDRFENGGGRKVLADNLYLRLAELIDSQFQTESGQ